LKTNFKKGEKVECVRTEGSNGRLSLGVVYEVDGCNGSYVELNDGGKWYSDRFIYPVGYNPPVKKVRKKKKEIKEAKVLEVKKSGRMIRPEVDELIPITTTRRTSAGIQMADSLIEFVHLMYQKQTAKGVLISLISRLQERKSEFD